MNSIISGLDKRLDVALKNSSDKDFYLNLYHYFDYIEKNQNLKAFLIKVNTLFCDPSGTKLETVKHRDGEMAGF